LANFSKKQETEVDFFQNFQGFQGILAKSFENLANFPQKIHRKRK